MKVRRWIARTLFRLARWSVVGRAPRSGIFLGAPHTSNWDFVLAVLVLWQAGATPRILVKKEFFHGPVGLLLRLTGGVPVDRENAAGVVDALAAQTGGEHPFVVVIAAEGSRAKGEYWKSGFYRLSRQTGLPVLMGFVDGPTRTVGIGPSLVTTGDVKADMDQVRAFYADKHGLRPRLRTEPRLRDETGSRPDR